MIAASRDASAIERERGPTKGTIVVHESEDRTVCVEEAVTAAADETRGFVPGRNVRHRAVVRVDDAEECGREELAIDLEIRGCFADPGLHSLPRQTPNLRS
jgi:hypothetical protein